MHQEGGFGSIGYRYPWKPLEAEKLVLRTHTTSISTALLYKLAQSSLHPSLRDSLPGGRSNDVLGGSKLFEQNEAEEDVGGFKPAKMFSIDRVFRNEVVDMTHLAEFHQVEGVVADKNLTLGDLIGAFLLSSSSPSLLY